MENPPLTKVPSAKRGRPTLADHDKKMARNISISSPAWQGLEVLRANLQVKSISELCELIGSGKLKISFVEEATKNLMSEISIYQRLKGLVTEPIAVFGSVVAFTLRMGLQLEITDEKELEELTERVIEEAISIIFYIGYLYPDCYINNPSALMRYLVYKILSEYVEFDKEKQIDTQHSFSLDKKSRKKIMSSLTCTYNNIHSLHMQKYSYLRMKTLNGLTFSQIMTILNLNNSLKVSHAMENKENDTEETLRRKIKNGLVDLRSFSSDIDFEDEIEEEHLDKESEIYYEIAMKIPLHRSKTNLIILEKILLLAIHDTNCDFWLNEIDYHLTREIFNSKEKSLGMHIAKISERLRKTLNEEEFLSKKKRTADRILIKCESKKQIEEQMELLISQDIEHEFSIRIDLDIWSLLYEKFLGRNTLQYREEIKSLTVE
jgi:hypothetical protein